jgi:hypothetical protein
MLLFMEFVTVFSLGLFVGVACAMHIIIDKDDESPRSSAGCLTDTASAAHSLTLEAAAHYYDDEIPF